MSLKIKLLVLDVDGVLTDGKKLYNLNGEVVAKSFIDRDSTYIKLFLQRGIQVLLLSGDYRVNKRFAEAKKLPFIYAPERKAEALKNYMSEHGVEWRQTAYVGDDLPDQKALDLVAEPYIPANAAIPLRSGKYRRLVRSGGEGVVEEVYFDLELRGLL